MNFFSQCTHEMDKITQEANVAHIYVSWKPKCINITLPFQPDCTFVVGLLGFLLVKPRDKMVFL
jgi:hypothetical protein